MTNGTSFRQYQVYWSLAKEKTEKVFPYVRKGDNLVYMETLYWAGQTNALPCTYPLTNKGHVQ